jgi:hypothetical protein
MIAYGILMLVPLVTGLAIGLTFADVDIVFKFLTHRSALTHSFLPPLGAFFIYKALKEQKDWVRVAIIGLSLGMAIHLSFDVFPVGWRGMALVHIPFVGRTNAAFSVFWFGLSMIACFYLALLLQRNAVEVSLSVLSLTIAFGFYSTTERFFWHALAVLTLTLVIALFLPESGTSAAHTLRKHLKT